MVMTHNQHTATLLATDIRELYNEKKAIETCEQGNSVMPASVFEQLTTMNVTSLSTVVGAADLSQRPTGSVLFRREDGLNKVYPHLVFSASSQDERRSDHSAQHSEGYSVLDNNQRSEKEEKKLTAGYKHPLWDGGDSISVEQYPQAYDSPFFSENQQSRVPQLHPSPYNIGPLLLKDPSMSMKPQRNLLHSNSMSLPWDKSAAALFGPLYSSPPQKNRLVMSKSSPADLEELSEDEKERVRVKRERNRVAAAKCRNRRRELLERLEKEAEVLEREQEVLRENVKKLQAQKRRYQALLETHEPTCALNVTQNNA